MSDVFVPGALGFPRDAEQAMRRKAKRLREEAQLRLLDTVPSALDYLHAVATGTVSADPERIKVCLFLAGRVLPSLGAVKVDASAALGVPEPARDTGGDFIEALRQASREADRRVAALREVRTLEHRPDDAEEVL